MGKDLTISLLYDFYGEMLTEKQREVIELYYNQDLSLAEIAAHSGITRQGVRDSIKRAEQQLRQSEELLGLVKRFGEIRQTIAQIVRCAQEIELINDRFCFSKDITQRSRRIIELSAGLSD